MRALARTTALFLIVFLCPSAAWSENAECGPSAPGPGFTRYRPEPLFQGGLVFTKQAPGRGFAPSRPKSVDKFVLTNKAYPPDTDFEAAVKEEYGPNATVADWSDVVADIFTEKDAETFANAVGLERQAGDDACHNYFVSVDGADLFARRYRYLLARHDGLRSPDWLILDQSGDDYLHLSRGDHPSQILVRLHEGPKPEATNQLSAEWIDFFMLAKLHFDGQHVATLPYDDLTIKVGEASPGGGLLPIATGWSHEKRLFALEVEDKVAEGVPADVRVMRLDPTTTAPQIVFTYFSMGAHCCTVTEIATVDSAGTWHVVDGGALDGGGYVFSDLDGDNGAELVSKDNSFLYAFGHYPESYAPTRISKLVGSELRDVTHDNRYQPFLREELHKMATMAEQTSATESFDETHSNGYLAGWVAQKSLVGELEGAWKIMLASYDRNSDWPLEECLIDAPIDQCPDEKRRKLNFPQALAKHLIKGGYATDQELEQLQIP